jgi:predicted metalloprotease with PDZ domain
MLQLKVFYQNPLTKLLFFEFTINQITTSNIAIQLPTWRPGRYELQNFAKNIHSFEVVDRKGDAVAFHKTHKDRWQINTQNLDRVIVRYSYYANQLDAGGSYLSEDFCYINWINCAMYVEGRENETYQIDLRLPKNYKIACGLKQQIGKTTLKLLAENFYKLAAAPMIASPTIAEYTYQIDNLTTTFHIWVQGKWKPDETQLLADFQQFTAEQVDIFANHDNLQTAFPETDYHFLLLIPPYTYHHGVEHYNSTMLVLGLPLDKDFQTLRYHDFLSLCCHELFHFWNICRIRPLEMLPYDYTKENYFETGFIAEGITTYYGEYLLARSKVWQEETFIDEINTWLQRHFENFGRFNYSLVESSYDLWLDGYVAGIPNRKVSIYNEGALAALILDLEIRRLTDNTKSLDDVLKILWTDFALKNKGYTLQDYRNIVYKVTQFPMSDYFQECILGRGYVEKWLQQSLSTIGYEIIAQPTNNLAERYFGFRLSANNSRWIVSKIAPNSPAETALCLGDELLSIDNQAIDSEKAIQNLFNDKYTVVIQVLRHQKIKTLSLSITLQTYFDSYTLRKKTNLTPQMQENFDKWIKREVRREK